MSGNSGSDYRYVYNFNEKQKRDCTLYEQHIQSGLEIIPSRHGAVFSWKRRGNELVQRCDVLVATRLRKVSYAIPVSQSRLSVVDWEADPVLGRDQDVVRPPLHAVTDIDDYLTSALHNWQIGTVMRLVLYLKTSDVVLEEKCKGSKVGVLRYPVCFAAADRLGVASRIMRQA